MQKSYKLQTKKLHKLDTKKKAEMHGFEKFAFEMCRLHQ